MVTYLELANNCREAINGIILGAIKEYTISVGGNSRTFKKIDLKELQAAESYYRGLAAKEANGGGMIVKRGVKVD